MRPRAASPHLGHSRPGKTLVMFALLLPVLLGMVGLVIDSGLLMAAHRQAHNAADAAALAAAMDKMRGETDAKAVESANAFVDANGLTDSSSDLALNGGPANALNLPPQSGPHAGDARYAEAIVSMTVSTSFIHILGGDRQRTVQARAVAGFEAVSSGEGAIVLDPRANQYSGLAVSGGAKLVVQGAVIVNSRGKQIDQYGLSVDSPYNQFAVSTGNNSAIYSSHLQVVGGVDVLDNIYHIEDYPGTTRNNPNPLYARSGIAPDPLKDIPVPVPPSLTVHGPLSFSGTNTPVVLQPGIYRDIAITNGANVTFSPGIYILSPSGPNQGLRVNGASTVTGDGVLFYATGSNYYVPASTTTGNAPTPQTTPGLYDKQDTPIELNLATNALPAPPDPDFNKVNFATVDINASQGAVVKLKGYVDSSGGPYQDLLFFQRRRNQNTVQIQGNAGENFKLSGTMYAKWANFKLSGGGKYDSQFVVGSMNISGQATVTINSNGKSFGRANQVFLVE